MVRLPGSIVGLSTAQNNYLWHPKIIALCFVIILHPLIANKVLPLFFIFLLYKLSTQEDAVVKKDKRFAFWNKTVYIQQSIGILGNCTRLDRDGHTHGDNPVNVILYPLAIFLNQAIVFPHTKIDLGIYINEESRRIALRLCTRYSAVLYILC